MTSMPKFGGNRLRFECAMAAQSLVVILNNICWRARSHAKYNKQYLSVDGHEKGLATTQLLASAC